MPFISYSLQCSENCIVLDENELIQQTFDPIYVTEEEVIEKSRVMREEVEVAALKRSKSKNFAIFKNFYLFILSRRDYVIFIFMHN